ncbi:hypothetical protein QBC40DRAFT_259935 [Triangularia verruculosa]|uniref:Uncharacterized protein n=1 Tax=Triangularia verruculosa TaxID=2587418 RepID=A0AAN7APM6_9PEZI|nr:hypothetical protein QBC40DRAFT_259935 [Triangularia verruculosa]
MFTITINMHTAFNSAIKFDGVVEARMNTATSTNTIAELRNTAESSNDEFKTNESSEVIAVSNVANIDKLIPVDSIKASNFDDSAVSKNTASTKSVGLKSMTKSTDAISADNYTDFNTAARSKDASKLDRSSVKTVAGQTEGAHVAVPSTITHGRLSRQKPTGRTSLNRRPRKTETFSQPTGPIIYTNGTTLYRVENPIPEGALGLAASHWA